MADYIINKKQVHLDPSQVIGKGGEADIYKINNKAVKIYKTPQHPDLVGMPDDQQAAAMRLKVHQTKLKDFPTNMPPEVVSPEHLVYDRQNKVAGYTMRFLNNCEVLMRYGERNFRTSITNNMIMPRLLELRDAVDNIHKVQAVIGDFNDLNVLVSKDAVHICDADSFQYGQYPCMVFTNRFVDPTLCKLITKSGSQSKSMTLGKPHNAESDWYAFAVMLFQTFLFVDPYGGIYKPANIANKIPHPMRPLHRITVFHPEVKYPKPAIPYKVLPDDLLQFFVQLFEKDVRNGFPKKLLENIRWTVCKACGTEHARGTCPTCMNVTPQMVQQVIEIRGTVTSTQVFQTRGSIVFATMQNGKLRYIYHENGKFIRDSKNVVDTIPLRPSMRFRICGDATLIGKNAALTTYGKIHSGSSTSFSSSTDKELLSVDEIGNLTLFDTNSKRRFWIENGSLYRDGQWGKDLVGQVLKNQTLFWVGEAFGFGFYRAGALSGAFVFDAEKGILNDTVKLPLIKGQLIDSTAVFSDTHVWFFTTTMENGRKTNRCIVILRNGNIVGAAEAEEGDGSWLGKIRGHAAMHNFLLASTDDGIVSVSAANGDPVKSKEYPDTEPFVDAESNLFAAIENRQVVIYVVNKHDVKVLKIK